MTSINIGNGLTSIYFPTFSGCRNVVTVALNSNSVTSSNYRKDHNFSDLFGEQVKEYIIGSDVRRIGNNAFYGCSELTTAKILCQESAEIGENAFYNCSKLNVVELGKGVSSIGNSAFGECKNIQDVVSHIDMIFPGTRLTVPQRGINIIRMSDGTTKKVVIK